MIASERCKATHWFSDEPLSVVRQCARGTSGTDADHGSTSYDPHETEEGRWWCVWPPRKVGT